MDQYNMPYLEMILVACGFLILQYLQIVLIARYGLCESDREADDDSFPYRYSYLHQSEKSGSNSGATRRNSFSHSSPVGKCYSKRRGRRAVGIKHL